MGGKMHLSSGGHGHCHEHVTLDMNQERTCILAGQLYPGSLDYYVKLYNREF